jgi:hypothetical protein
MDEPIGHSTRQGREEARHETAVHRRRGGDDVSRLSRREYAKHTNDAFDRFLTEQSRGADGKFSFAKMTALFEALDCPEFIPSQGTNGTKRMTAGILLRNWFPDGKLRFKDGSAVQLNLDEET